MQRFKAALPTGNYPGNPEDLVRDKDGDFVLYADVKKPVVDEQKKRWAEKIIRIADSNEDDEYPWCPVCEAGPYDSGVMIHEDNCHSHEAKQYIEGIEAE